MEHLHIFPFLDDKHGQRAENIERNDDHYEHENQIDCELLVFHHLVHRRVALISVHHLVFVPKGGLEQSDAELGATFARCQFNGRNLVFTGSHQFAHGLYRDNHQV